MNKERIYQIIATLVILIGTLIVFFIPQLLRDRATISHNQTGSIISNDIPTFETMSFTQGVFRIEKNFPISGIGSSFIQHEIDATIQSFTEENTQSLLPGNTEPVRPYILSIQTNTYSTDTTISYTVLYFYDTGGAHGNSVTRTYVFDRNTQERITFEQLFPSPLSQTINRIMIQLQKEFPQGLWIPENEVQWYEIISDSFIISEDGNALFIFDPYDIAPYAFGRITVSIPIEPE